MACLLTIETATPVCSVALSKDGASVFEKINVTGASHASLLGEYISEALNHARKRDWPVDAVAVSAGPGSYTGLRIGVSAAKGVCYGLAIPLLAIPTLKIIALSTLRSLAPSSPRPLICAMIDARRMEVYAAIFDADLNEVRETQADVIDANSYGDYLDHQAVIFAGNGSNKCRAIIHSPNAVFVENIYPAATAMIPLAEAAFARKEFADAACFEPFYLKEFQATTARNKVLPV